MSEHDEISEAAAAAVDRSQFLNGTDKLIVLAAMNILRDVANTCSTLAFSGADHKTAAIMHFGAVQAQADTARTAISNALIAIQVHDEHYPPSVPEPQSIRA